MIEWWIPGGVIAVAFRVYGHEDAGPVAFAVDLAGTIAWTVAAAIDLLTDDIADAAVCAAFAGVYAYYAWRNRPRKNRFAEKALGVVRNLGHRLVVVPVGGRS